MVSKNEKLLKKIQNNIINRYDSYKETLKTLNSVRIGPRSILFAALSTKVNIVGCNYKLFFEIYRDLFYEIDKTVDPILTY